MKTFYTLETSEMSVINKFEALPIIPEGEYQFTIIQAEEKLSKKGKEIISLWLKIVNESGETLGKINHCIMDVNHSCFINLRKELFEAIGKKSLFYRGYFTAKDFMRGNGKCTIKIQKIFGYPDKNIITHFEPIKDIQEQVITDLINYIEIEDDNEGNK